jgi:predicted nucleic acid-binding protein
LAEPVSNCRRANLPASRPGLTDVSAGHKCLVRDDECRASAAVADWISRQYHELLYTASVCQAEILYGLAILPENRRRADLEEAAHAMFIQDFEGRVLAFDMAAAAIYAELFAARKRAGRPAATIDLLIAAIARANGASVVTRKMADFDQCGVGIINPWDG